MSRSTESTGSPDDAEGPLDDDLDGAADSTDAERDADEEPEDDESDDITSEDGVSEDAESADGVSEDEDSGDEDSEDADVAEPVAAGAQRSRSGRRPTSDRADRAAVRPRPARPAARTAPAPGRPVAARNPFAAIVLFVRQVIAELRKVVTPTSKELGTYVAVVIVFVIVVMAYVGVIDFAVGKLVLWAFGG